MNQVTVSTLMQHKQQGEKITCLTAYDASFSALMAQAKVEVILVGDSMGMVIQGHDSTLPVTLDEMIYHTKAVTAANHYALMIADMPFMSDGTSEQALMNAGRLIKEGGAHMVKLEGGENQVGTVKMLSNHNIAVCAHLGLQPQSIHKLGGYKVQGRDEKTASQILNDALALEQAGANLLVLECVPAALAKRISEKLTIPTIGIGAGVDCDGQVLVVYDLIGISYGKIPKFAKNFLSNTGSIVEAIQAYVDAVKAKAFPEAEHTFLKPFMEVFYAIKDARDYVESHKLLGQSIGLVPTMGNLHAGHMRLVAKASEQTDKVVVSLFVNPMQFGPNEDFDSYPRSLEADLALLKNAGVAMVFVPKTQTIYPEGAQGSTEVSVPKVAKILEGEYRPAFFTGVASVVAKLFHILPASVAVFGKKDYQQLKVITHMVDDLCFPIKIVAVETVREPDGLAMSSRNTYLSATDRIQAAILFQTLQQAETALLSGMSAQEVERKSIQKLDKAGFEVDYFAIRNKETLGAFLSPSQSVILVAAKIGATRLIDNLEVHEIS